MIEQGLFKKYFVGRDGFYWWIGQIAPEESWRDNKNGIPSANNKDTPGFGERYKVRIMGHHTASPSELSDDELPWATVMYPVTAGGGTGASSQNANLRQGMFVFGFFMDGEDGQQPVIMGVIGTNSYTAVMKNVPDSKFIPFTGLSEQFGDRVATYARTASDSEGEVAPVADEVKGEPTENSTTINSPEGNTEVEDAASSTSAEEKEKDIPIPQPSHCDPIPFEGIQLSLANTIKDIEKLRSTLTDYRQAATKGVSDLKAEIDKKQNKLIKEMYAGLQWLIDIIITNYERAMNFTFKQAAAAQGAAMAYNLKSLQSEAIETILCNVKKLFVALIDYLADVIGDILSKVVNAATCFIENFVSSIIAQIDNLVTQMVEAVFGAINGVIGAAFNFADFGLSLVSDIASVVQDILGLLQCEQDGCEEWQQSQWNIITGGRTRTTPGEIADKINSFRDEFDQVFDFTNGITDVIENQFQFNFDSLFDDETCDVGPLLCGPPSLVLFSGTGAGFSANPVVSESGAVIGVDIIALGGGYKTDSSYAKIVDPCGNGNGGVVLPFIGNNPFDFYDFLNGDDGFEGSGNDFDGRGRVAITDPFWAGRRAEIGGGGVDLAGGGITNPVFSDGPIFTGNIPGDRLAVSGPDFEDSVRPSGGGGGRANIDIINPSFDQPVFPGFISSERIDLDSVGPGITNPAFLGADRPTSGGAGGLSIQNPAFLDRVGIRTLGGRAARVDIADPSFLDRAVGIRTITGSRAPRNSITDPPSSGVVGFIIKSTGGSYLTKADGSLGGMNRVWAKVNETKVKKKDGTYLKPFKPGTLITLEPGDTVQTPNDTKVVTEKLKGGSGGGEEIIGGTPYILKKAGVITAPAPGFSVDEVSIKSPGLKKFYPSSSDGTYPVIMYMLGLFIDNPGVKYEVGDEIVISPSKGAKAKIHKVTEQGSIVSIKLTSQGEGYKEMPNVFVRSTNGSGAKLLPQLGVNRVTQDDLDDEEIESKVVNVVDSTGTIASGSGGIY